MNSLKYFIELLLPRPIYRFLIVPYHFLFSFLSALWHGFPGRHLFVIGVTGTKGKSTVAEMLASIFREAGHTVALSSTIHFEIGNTSTPNLHKMTLPGRGFIQKFLARAVRAKCDVAIVELTSESAVQYRHLFLFLNALVFTNLQKEHLESHGGMENYFQAKMRLGKALCNSFKRPRVIIAHEDDTYGKRFLKLPVEKRISFSARDVVKGAGHTFTYADTSFSLNHPGDFNVLNALASIKTAEAFNISPAVSSQALQKLTHIAGRTERIEAGQSFTAIVDYAHTPDSLRALYSAYPHQRKICVLGNTGGGRDTWKRPEMGKIAEESCAEVILTNEDPYDESPAKIVEDMAKGMTRAPRIIMDRREAIATALKLASGNDVVLVSGKGTDPYIMGASGAKTPWSDAGVVREELERLQK